MRRFVMARRWWRALFAVVLPVSLVVALMPMGHKEGGIEHADKLIHISVFAGLSMMACMAWPGHYRNIGVGLIAYGALVEVLQGVATTHRAASFADLAADAVGTALGLYLASRFLVKPQA